MKGRILLRLLQCGTIVSSFSINGKKQGRNEADRIVQRISAEDFRAQNYYQDIRPLLIQDALSLFECEECCDLLMQQSHKIQVDLQRQQQKQEKWVTEIYNCQLDQAIEAIMVNSNSQDAFFSFGEGMLQEYSHLHPIQEKVTLAKENLFPEDDPDWFSYFPSWAQPMDALILAGAGASSTLHRDPIEWTGTSLCLEGTKVWKFIEPCPNVTEMDRVLDSYRLKSIAWQDQTLSAGWQSDFSLYHTRRHDSIPRAKELASMDPGSEKDCRLTELATDLNLLQPNIDTISSEELVIHTAIQNQGDLLLIPAHWWHQTFAFEPSVAIASQRCGIQDAPLVFGHILDQAKGDRDIDALPLLKSAIDHPKRAVEQLFRALQA